MEVNTSSKEEAYAIKDNLDLFLKEEVFPLLEEYFRNLEKDIPADSLRIEKLDIDLNLKEGFKYDELKQKIVSEVEKTIFKKIKNVANSDNKDIQRNESDSLLSNSTKTLVQSFFYFLEKGTLPWWDTSTAVKFLSDNNVLQEIIETNGFERVFFEKIKTRTTQKRLIKQFSDVALKKILLQAYQNQIQEEVADQILNDEFLTILTEVSSAQRFQLWECVIQFFRTESIPEFYNALKKCKKDFRKELGEHYKVWFDEIIIVFNTYDKEISTSDQNTSEPVFKKIETEDFSKEKEEVLHQKEIENFDVLQESKDEPESDEIQIKEEDNYYINNAGLILIHPFIKQFFEVCGLLDDDTIEDKELAIHLLHYIATKEQQQPEYLMIFEKFLCNVPIGEPISRAKLLTKKQKNQADELVAAVLQNWGALRDSSTDLLRNEFLQRPGKLILNDKNPKLIIERKTQDILLDRLPWNISVVKLPWKEKLIFVDW